MSSDASRKPKLIQALVVTVVAAASVCCTRAPVRQSSEATTPEPDTAVSTPSPDATARSAPDVVSPPPDTGPAYTLPAQDCTEGALLACENGRGPGGLGDAVWRCENGEPKLTTCWEYCRTEEELPRTNGCAADEASVSCQCADAQASGHCSGSDTIKYCSAPNWCTQTKCEDVCIKDGYSAVGCGLYWSNPETGYRQEGCLCSCAEVGARRCNAGGGACQTAPLCPDMAVCHDAGLWVGVNGYQWCGAHGTQPDMDDPFCYQDLGEFLCVPPSGCDAGAAYCLSDSERLTCDGQQWEVSYCAQVCKAQGFDTTLGCADGQCECWNDPCADPPQTPWKCGGGEMWRCVSGTLVTESCTSYCSELGKVHNDLCVYTGDNRICGCVSKAKASCSTGYWSDGGVSCNTYWNGTQCCESCVMFGTVHNTCD